MRSNINLNFGETLREHRYLNCAKSAQRPLNSSALSTYWLDMDADFYPTTLSNPLSFTVYLHKAGTYVVRFKGRGAYTHTSFGTLSNASSGIYTGGGAGNTTVTNGRMTFTVGSAGTRSNVTVKSDGTMTDFVICHIDDEAKIDAGQIFRDEFLDLIRAYNPHTIRFMDSQSTNRSVLSNWADRPRTTQLSYNTSNYLRSNIPADVGGGLGVATWSDTGSADAYVAGSYTGMPVAYQHGEIVHLRAGTTNTRTAVTLDVGGRGAKSVIDEQQLGVTIGSIASTVPRTYVFDAFYDKWFVALYSPNNEPGAMLGHPIEMMVALCNAASVPGWFCIPAYATDDFVTQFANYLVPNYTPGYVLIEYGNEIWNSALGFPMTVRMAKWGDVTFSGIGSGNNANFSGWYGYRMRQIATIMRAIFAAAGQSAKVKIVLAFQGAQGDSAGNLTNVIENKRFQNASFAALTGANAPILFADYVSYALYYGGAHTRDSDSGWTGLGSTILGELKTQVDKYTTAVAASDMASIRETFEWYRDDFITNAATTVASNGRYGNVNTLATSYGKQVVHYEHNHQVMAPSASWASGNAVFADSSYGGPGGKIENFIYAFFASEQYGQAVSYYLAKFESYSQSLATSIFGMCSPPPWLTFPLVSPATEGSGYGGDSTQPPFANWRIHSLANNGKRRMLVKT